MLESSGYDSMGPEHLVATYAIMHEHVYGIEAGEVSEEFGLALRAARKVARAVGSSSKVIAFMRWAWAREKRSEERRSTSREADDFRISWKYQFSMKLLTNYRIWQSRRGKIE